MKMDLMMNGRCSEIQNHHKTGSYFSACSFTFKARIPVMLVDHANRGCQPVAERVGLRHDRDQIRWHYPPLWASSINAEKQGDLWRAKRTKVLYLVWIWVVQKPLWL